MYENIAIVLDVLFLGQIDSSRERLGAAQTHPDNLPPNYICRKRPMMKQNLDLEPHTVVVCHRSKVDMMLLL